MPTRYYNHSAAQEIIDAYGLQPPVMQDSPYAGPVYAYDPYARSVQPLVGFPSETGLVLNTAVDRRFNDAVRSAPVYDPAADIAYGRQVVADWANRLGQASQPRAASTKESSSRESRVTAPPMAASHTPGYYGPAVPVMTASPMVASHTPASEASTDPETGVVTFPNGDTWDPTSGLVSLNPLDEVRNAEQAAFNEHVPELLATVYGAPVAPMFTNWLARILGGLFPSYSAAPAAPLLQLPQSALATASRAALANAPRALSSSVIPMP